MIVMRVLVTSLCLLVHGGALGEATGEKTAVRASVVEQTRSIRQSILEDEIRLPETEPNAARTQPFALESLIAELENLKVNVETPPAPKTEPGEKSEASPKPALPVVKMAPQEVEEQPREETIADPEAARTTALMQKMESVLSVPNPLEVADALYRGRRTAAAERFYRRMVEAGRGPQDADYLWALYQSAVCKVSQDPAGARRLFQQLIESCPNSPWTAAAKARLAVLTWEEELKAKKIKWIQSDPNSL